MKDYSKEECKDASPAATVARVCGILGGLGIILTEENIKSTSGTFSTKLYFKGTVIGSQGKGVSRALSRASAYGEFIERLQNMILAAPFNFSPEVLSQGPFRFAPDERVLTADAVARQGGGLEAVYAFHDAESTAQSPRGASLLKWLQAFPGTDTEAFTSLPFCSLIDGVLRYVPWQALSLYRSNGMCAGNTREEALVQGVSEILERHVNRLAIAGQVTPPDVPAAYLKRFKRPAAIIREIEKGGVYKVVVKDFSLGRFFPVLGVILISLKDQAYMVNFGAHPRFEIALERCLTEALQSYRVDSRLGKSLLPFSFLAKPLPAPSNFINSVRLGRGHFPGALFLKHPDYKFRKWRNPGPDNKAMLRDLLLFVKGLGLDVLVRDKSFLGFPAYQVLIPGMSEVEEPVDIFLPSAILRTEVGELMRDIPRLSPEQCDKLLSFITSRLSYIYECHNLSGFLNFPVKNGAAFDSMPVPLFLAKVCRRKGDLKRSHAIICTLLGRLGPRGGDELKCVRDYLGIAKEGVDSAAIASVLRYFYPAPLVKKVMAEWGSRETVFKDFPRLPCMNCSSCSLRRYCLKPVFLRLYGNLKQRIATIPLDQASLRSLSLSA